MSLDERARRVLAEVFDIPEASIDGQTSPDNVEKWDSLKHMMLVLALEEEFNVHFSDTETIELLNFDLIKLTLNDKGVS